METQEINGKDEDMEFIAKAQLVKEEGNMYFQAQEYDLAVDSYSRAIDLLLPENFWIIEGDTQENSNIESSETLESINDHSKQEDSESNQETRNNTDFPRHRKLQTKKEVSIVEKIPKKYHSTLSIFFCNRAACYSVQSKWELVLQDSTHALELQPNYAKAFLRRAKANESLDKLDEALKDYQSLLELDPSSKEAIDSVKSLPPRIQEKQERMKEEVMGQMKDLGNKFLSMFGMSLDNFQMQKDPSGNYSVNIKK